MNKWREAWHNTLLVYHVFRYGPVIAYVLMVVVLVYEFEAVHRTEVHICNVAKQFSAGDAGYTKALAQIEEELIILDPKFAPEHQERATILLTHAKKLGSIPTCPP